MAPKGGRKLSSWDIAGIVARNLVPIAGIAFLGWNAAMLLVVYYVDLMVSWVAYVIADLWEQQEEFYANLVKLGLFACFWGAVLGFPLLYGWREITFDPYLALACLVQVGLAAQVSVKQQREVSRTLAREFSQRRRDAATDGVKDRFFGVFLRWLMVWIAAMSGSAAVTVGVYLTVSVCLEIWPPRPFSSER